jgi:hypothetical protein
MTLTKVCRDAKVDAVPHGFRSSFRDWVSEETIIATRRSACRPAARYCCRARTFT